MNNDALVAKIDVDRRQFRSTRTSMQTESHTLKKEKELMAKIQELRSLRSLLQASQAVPKPISVRNFPTNMQYLTPFRKMFIPLTQLLFFGFGD